MSGLPLLAIESPQHRQAEVAILSKRQGDGDTKDDPVQSEPECLVSFGRQHSVEKDTTKGDLGPALMAERVVYCQPDHTEGNQVGQDQGSQDHPQIIPLPSGGVKDGVGRVVMPSGGQAGGLPNLADGVGTDANDPAGEQNLESLEDFNSEATPERFYQRGEAGDKLIHGAGLRANSVNVVLH